MVEDGRDAAISEGAGSLGIELLSDGDAFDCIVLPLGNGALINGVGRWVKAASPATQVIGVSSTGADAMEASWRQDSIVQRNQVSTIADGIAVRTPIPEALEDMRDLVDEVIPVSDDNIIDAMRLLHGRANVVAEPAGAAGVAAILARPELFRGRRVATVICGSNLTNEDAQRWLQDDPVDK